MCYQDVLAIKNENIVELWDLCSYVIANLIIIYCIAIELLLDCALIVHLDADPCMPWLNYWLTKFRPPVNWPRSGPWTKWVRMWARRRQDYLCPNWERGRGRLILSNTKHIYHLCPTLHTHIYIYIYILKYCFDGFQSFFMCPRQYIFVSEITTLPMLFLFPIISYHSCFQ